MAEPIAMFSGLYGPVTEAWHGGTRPYDPADVRYWNLHADRSATMPYHAGDREAEAAQDAIAEGLRGLGFTIEAQSPVGVSFSAPASFVLEESGLGVDPFSLVGRTVRVVQETVPVPAAFANLAAIEVLPYAVPASPLRMSRRSLLAGAGAALGLVACPGLGTGPGTGTPLLAEVDVEALRDLLGLQAAGRGAGVHVAVIDSGWVPAAGDRRDVTVLPPLGGLQPDRDERGHGTAVIEHLLAVAPGARVTVSRYADQSGYRNYPVAAFQRAVWGLPPEGGVAALPSGRALPDIVLCSWVLASHSVALQREIAEAVRQGVTVIFAAGNGTMADVAATALDADPDERVLRLAYQEDNRGEVDDPLAGRSGAARALGARRVHAVSHPDALVVGGAFPQVPQAEPLVAPPGLVASEVATAYDSGLYAAEGSAPLRPVPEVCGLVASLPAELVPPGLFRTRTARGSVMDEKPEPAGPAPDDGAVLASGTSMAAAHVAGLAALLLEQHPDLGPVGVRHVMQSTTRDVASGASGGPVPRSARDGWDEATGHGVVDAMALAWLDAGPRPFLRASVLDRGDDRDAAGLQDSPDVLLRAEEVGALDRQAHLGIVVRHRGDLSDAGPTSLPTVPPAVLYVRVGNRGDAPWTGDVRLYAVPRFGVAPQEVGVQALTVEAGGYRVSEAFALDEVDGPVLLWLVLLGGATLPAELGGEADLQAYLQGEERAGVAFGGAA